VSTVEEGRRLAELARAQNRTALAHLKINTGMARFGVDCADALSLAAALTQLQNFELQGAFTHFTHAGEPENPATRRQFAQFSSLLGPLKELMPQGLFHCCNSAALVAFPTMRLNAARPGTLLYGQYPTPAIADLGRKSGLQLQDPFVAKSRVIALRDVPEGTSVGYGSDWRAPRAAKIAVLACGYADGLTIEPRARPETPWTCVRGGLERAARLAKNPHAGRMVTLRGHKVPLVGRVAMQCCFADVTGIPGVGIGDEAIVPMRRVNAGAHLPRVYKNDAT
jgi:alanine racemase